MNISLHESEIITQIHHFGCRGLFSSNDIWSGENCRKSGKSTYIHTYITLLLGHTLPDWPIHHTYITPFGHTSPHYRTGLFTTPLAHTPHHMPIHHPTGTYIIHALAQNRMYGNYPQFMVKLTKIKIKSS